VKVAFRDSFARDVKAVRDSSLLKRLKEVIEAVEDADSLADLPNLKNLKANKNYFRIRVGITALVSRLKTTPLFSFAS